MKYFLIIALLMASCDKQQTYTCVCYSKQTPEIYKKHPIQNTYAESVKYCESMSNAQQSCNLSK